MKLRGPAKTVRSCFVEGCGGRGVFRVVSPNAPYVLKLACGKCRDELVEVAGWEAVR